ncbi:MAG: glycosyltransferase family 2 protein [Nanoarchaeota archaeon]|nr:glycosyltransferase family 2 protein [Nanoarchaeota archaeon]
MKKSLTIIVPAYNEEKNLEDTINTINNALNNFIEDYETLIFNDCSKDKTGEIADWLAKKDKKIKVIHNKVNMGLGYNYIKGIELATKEFVMMIPGDDDIPEESIKKILKEMGNADIINNYFTNPFEVRSFHRVLISKGFVKLMNLLLGLNLKYYTGTVLHKNSLLKNMKIKNYNFSYQVEILAKLLKSGHSFKEVGVKQTGKGTGSSHFYTFKNFKGILFSISSLLWVLKFKERNKYNKQPIKIN